jgi:hypothetical protein
VPAWICETCGVQHADTEQPPAVCLICEDFRQYVGPDGQRWTTLERLASDHRADVRPLEPGLYGVGVTPPVGIGQRALLAWSPAGNLLWDCVPMLPELASKVRGLGGIHAIAVSHPHFYSTVGDWSREFEAPVWLPRADAAWRMREDFEIREWEGAVEVVPGSTLIRVGGHFEGSAVFHWTDGEGSEGALFTGDSIMVAPDRRWTSFMRSYPNQVPLPAREVVRISEAVAPFRYRRVYGGWWDRVIHEEGDEAVQRSAERYLRAISEGV